MCAVILDPEYRDRLLSLERSTHLPSLDVNCADKSGWINCELHVSGERYTYRTVYSPDEGYVREIVDSEGYRIWAIVYPDSSGLHPCYAPTLRAYPFLPNMPKDDRLGLFQQLLEDRIIDNIAGYIGHGWCIFQLETGWTVDPVYLKCKKWSKQYYITTIVQNEKYPDRTEWKIKRCEWGGNLPIKKRGAVCIWGD